MNVNINFAFGFLGVGMILAILGLFHLNPFMAGWDARIFLFLHTEMRSYTNFYRYLWPLGTSPVGVMLILIIFIADYRIGWITALMYMVTAVVERTIKIKVDRLRPFENFPGVVMSQPKTPSDPSHPSGDSMRVWFLALVFPLAFFLHWPVFVLTIFLAIILSLGRIVLGVHYPLDVAGGAGLGIMAAGASIISYQALSII